ncbi:MAG TPA: cysteine hydrolase [Xanthobacteraceae bacterium]|nr:cysteine hydrolase [Xanthobacteraceae bacterium]
MHKIDIPQHIIDRVIERRGVLHCHENLDPRTTALIVIDLQNCFMVEEVASAYVPVAVEIVPAVNRLAAAVRETGGKVFWIRNTVNDDTLTTWSQWFAMMKANPDQIKRRVQHMKVGSRGHELHPDLIVKPEDQTVFKQRFSAFIQGSSGLPEMLRTQGYDTVLITGTVTNVCCESSARDAMMLNFKTIMVSDANAALTDAEHNATLCSIWSTFGDVMDTDYLIECLRRNAFRQAAE